MSKLVWIPLVMLGACATTGAMAGEGAPPVKTDLAVVGSLKAVNPRLPSADRNSSKIRAEVGDMVTADLDVCVAADGHVLGVLLVKSSSSPIFDGALLKDAPLWQFSEAPGSSRTCDKATVTYNLHP